MLAAENTEESPRKPLSDANITGHVQDAATGEHLPYITVVVKGTTIGTATDGTGHYFLKNLPAGEFVLEASMLGYGTVEKEGYDHERQDHRGQLRTNGGLRTHG